MVLSSAAVIERRCRAHTDTYTPRIREHCDVRWCEHLPQTARYSFDFYFQYPTREPVHEKNSKRKHSISKKNAHTCGMPRDEFNYQKTRKPKTKGHETLDAKNSAGGLSVRVLFVFVLSLVFLVADSRGWECGGAWDEGIVVYCCICFRWQKGRKEKKGREGRQQPKSAGERWYI